MAQLDPGIILAGQGVNALGAIAAGNEAAAFQRDALHQRDYRNMLAQNGAGIMAGDQGALNALAGYDPAAALGIQGKRQDMQFAQQRMDILTEQERRAAETYARGLSADQAAAEAAQLEGAVKQALMLPDAASWDAFMAQNGMTDLVGQFDNRQALAGKYMSMAEVLKQAFPEPVDPVKGAPSGYMWNAPGNPAAGVARIPGMDQGAGFRVATPDEAAQYGAAAGQFGPDGRFYPVNPPSGMSVETGPDGQLKIVQGPGAGAGGMKLTEAQGKDLVYWNRMTGVAPKLNDKDTALSGFGDTVAGAVPLVGNYMTSDAYKSAWRAGQEWLSGVLRKDTGAAITEQEMAIYGKMFLPIPGDGPEQIKQKREARKRAEDGIRLGLGTAEILAKEVEAQRATNPPPAASPAPDLGLSEDDLKYLGQP